MADTPDTLRVLQRVATHVVARSRVAESGRFSLRVLPGGFGTPEAGEALTRVRVSGAALVVESDAPGAPSALAVPIAGSTLRSLAAVAAVDLDEALDVGDDTPALGDVDEPLTLDVAEAERYHRWWALAAMALDRVAAGLGPDATPSMARLWPEHFDVALDAQARPGVRVNLGGSPGDDVRPEPYLYVGPWTEDRPGEAEFWNAPFGAAMPRSAMGTDPLADAVAFFETGLHRLREGAGS